MPPIPYAPRNLGEDGESANSMEKLLGFTGGARVKEFLKLAMGNEKDPEARNWMSLLLPHLHLVSASDDLAHPKIVFRYVVQAEHCNGLGNLHGGCAATIFDFCTSVAIAPLSRPGHWSYLGVSRTLSTTYLRPVPRGVPVLIECEVVQLGRKLCSLRAEMRREEDGVLLVTCEHGKFNNDPPATKL